MVIGGGAAGMMAALSAAREGARVTLLERNAKVGRKLYITGKGRCNVTNHCAAEEVLRNTPRNGQFLYSSMNAFRYLTKRRILLTRCLFSCSGKESACARPAPHIFGPRAAR